MPRIIAAANARAMLMVTGTIASLAGTVSAQVKSRVWALSARFTMAAMASADAG